MKYAGVVQLAGDTRFKTWTVWVQLPPPVLMKKTTKKEIAIAYQKRMIAEARKEFRNAVKELNELCEAHSDNFSPNWYWVEDYLRKLRNAKEVEAMRTYAVQVLEGKAML